MAEQTVDVVVVGAGIAGVYAARLLKNQFGTQNVLVVEAQERIGGRIKELHGFTHWPMQLGPEFVHGRHSSFVHYAQQLGVTFTEREWPDQLYFGKEKRLMSEDEVDEEVKTVQNYFSTFAREEKPPPGQDVSAMAWLRSKGATDKMMALADACNANDFSGPLDQIGLRELIEEDRRWDFGESYLIMDRGMGKVLESMAEGLNIITSCPITRVDYSGEGTHRVVLTSQGGRRIRCRAVVFTVSLRILQDGVISFNPPLPPAKQQAISRIKMGNVIKIMLGFSQRFWEPNMYDVVSTDSFVPEFWMLEYPHTDNRPGLANHSVVGFVAGTQYDSIKHLPEEELIRRFVAQLDEIFGTPENPKPATKALVKTHVIDWAKEPWVRGAYTYPTLHAEAHDREALAAPVDDCLYFAGEACNMDLNPCVHGAMDTAQIATVDVLLAHKPRPHSRL